MSEVHYHNLGLIDYKEAWDFQEKIFKATVDQKIRIRNGESNEPTMNHIFFCQHPHVFTLGKSGKKEHLLLNEQKLEEMNARYYEINRGGDITYHGPGQLVVYPIFDLDHFFTDIHKYLRFLEEAVIQTLAEYDIVSGRVDGLTGVWIDSDKPTARKICALGVKSSRWVTMHGIGFNVNSDLSYFSHIVPCGINDKAVTSIKEELGREIDFNEVSSILKTKLAQQFGYTYNNK
ncbi:MAG: lipoyl(octanoyl) transferase LipB [Crocinitomicaceae bacterium]|jgi:lipoyl(octanoyl) transferase|nr:lipoyl(octanoyl) transferase LipB [Crocinitomicaceae bacterium]